MGGAMNRTFPRATRSREIKTLAVTFPPVMAYLLNKMKTLAIFAETKSVQNLFGCFIPVSRDEIIKILGYILIHGLYGIKKPF